MASLRFSSFRAPCGAEFPLLLVHVCVTSHFSVLSGPTGQLPPSAPLGPPLQTYLARCQPSVPLGPQPCCGGPWHGSTSSCFLSPSFALRPVPSTLSLSALSTPASIQASARPRLIRHCLPISPESWTLS
eukprot:179800-Rhodomonas_salina.1